MLRRQATRNVVLASLAVLSCALILLALAPTNVDDAFYDNVLNWLPSSRPDAQVVLVDYDAKKAPSAETIAELVQETERAGAKTLILVAPKRHSGWTIAADTKLDVWQPRRVELSDRDNNGRLLPDFVGDSPDKTPSAWCLPLYRNGIARGMPSRIRIDAQSTDCIEPLLARSVGAHVTTQTQIWVDPVAALDRIPHFFLKGSGSLGWLDSVARDRVVMVVPSGEDRPHLIADRQHRYGVTDGEVHALALDSVLRGANVENLSWGWQALLIALYFVIGVWLSRRIQGRFGVFVALAAVVGISVLGAWVVLAGLHRVISMPALMVALFGASSITRGLHLSLQNESLQATTQNIEPVLQRDETRIPDEHSWQATMRFLHAQLGFERMVLYRRSILPYRVTDEAHFGCDATEVSERRRDWRRQPYSDALQARVPVQLSKPMLSECEGLTQYLVALRHADEIEGFWLYVRDPEQARDNPLQTTEIMSYANQLARLCFLRRQPSRVSEVDADPILKWFAGQAGQLPQRLHRDADELIQHLRVMQDVSHANARPMVVIDLYGKTLFANRAFEKFSQALATPLASMAALDLLAQLGQTTTTHAHQILREVVSQDRAIELPMRSDMHARRHVIQLHAVRAEQVRESRGDLPFRVLGIAFEFIDASGVANNKRWIADLLEDLSHRLRNDLEALGGAWEQVEDLGIEVPPMLGRIIEKRLQDGHHSIRTIESELVAALKSDVASTMPLNVAAIFNNAMRESNALLASRNLRLDTDIPTFCALGIASEQGLQKLLLETLQFLANDATPGSIIKLRICEHRVGDANSVQLRFSNEGIGAPDWHVAQAYQAAANEDSISNESEVEKLIANNITVLKRWGGEFDIASGIGKGFVITIGLRAFANA